MKILHYVNINKEARLRRSGQNWFLEKRYGSENKIRFCGESVRGKGSQGCRGNIKVGELIIR